MLSPEIGRTFELCVCLCVHACGERGRGRLILNLPSVVCDCGHIWTQFLSASLVFFAPLVIATSPVLPFFFFFLLLSMLFPLRLNFFFLLFK